MQHTCTADGSGVITYRFEGVAAGPYPGTFVETGRIVIGERDPQAVFFGYQYNRYISSFRAHFTIDSPQGQVTGNKYFDPAPGLLRRNNGLCMSSGQPVSTAYGAIIEDARYDAVIHTTDGSFADAGRTAVRMFGGSYTGTSGNAFFERYISDYVTPIPLNTPGKVEGGGEIGRVDGTGTVSFGFTAQVDEVAEPGQGQCAVVDHTAQQTIHCVSVTSMVQTPTRATFRGQARVNDVLEEYRIDVDDLSESGIGRDTFKIMTESGYTAGGVLTAGNIQIHPVP